MIRDKYLAKISLDEHSIISLDIFSTLLLSTVNEHSDIFLIVGKELCIQSSFPYAPETYRRIRQEVEETNFENGCANSLRNIIWKLPFPEYVKELAYNIELDVEASNLVINKSVSEYIKNCANKIILTSQSHYSFEEVIFLLRKLNYDIDLFSTYYKFPKDGKEVIIQVFKNISEMIPNGYKNIHIDHSRERVEIAHSLGIDAYVYGEAENPFDMYAFEKDVFGETVGEIRFLRNLAMCYSGEEPTEIMKFFYELGASIIAPVYALYAEWILKFCNKYHITYLMPLMREGTILSYCIKKLMRSNSIECEPLYVSRRALFNASITDENFFQKVEMILIKSKASPVILLNDVGVDISHTDFNKYKSVHDISVDGKLHQFKNFIIKNKKHILDYSNNQRNMFCTMIQNQMKGRSTATVDIGFSGTSERLIRDILQFENIELNLSHLILMGSEGTQVDNILSGLKIFSWLGLAGENTDITKRLMYQIQIIEVLINDICGTTIRYSIKDNKPFPVLDSVFPVGIESNNEKAKACQRGIKQFVSLWCHYRDKMQISKLLMQKKGFINIWRRLIEMPNYKEALLVGDLLLYDNYTEEKILYKVRGERREDIEDVDLFLKNSNKVDSEYPQAIIAFCYPEYFKALYLERTLMIPSVHKMLNIINQLLEESKNSKIHIAIFAAGQRGRDFLKVAKIFCLRIECFIDSNIELHGSVINGIPIISIKDAGNISHFINASYNYPEEITTIILDNYGFKSPKIYIL